jgi:acid phosphatase class B
MKRIVLCDIDGTLANVVHRLHLVSGEEKNWEEFNSKCREDHVKEDIANILRQIYADEETEISIITARENKWIEDTKRWLELNDIPYNTLHMRKVGDRRSDSDVKKEIFRKNYKKKNVWFVLEDRSKVVKMWRELGVTCLQVSEGDF